MNEVARKIKSLMVLKGIQTKQLAQKIGYSRTWVSLNLNGKRKSERTQRLIAEALGIPYEELWGEEEK